MSKQVFVKRGEPEVLGPDSARALQDFTRTVERIFSVRLDSSNLVESTKIKNGKEFCVGLLENPRQHAWWSSVSKLKPREQASVAGSLFLARKVLPCPPDPRQEAKHRRLMTSPAPPVSADFYEHIRTQICSIFEIGWDKGYQSAVFSYAPLPSACLEYGRSEGGVRRYLSEMGRDWFLDRCLGADQGAFSFPVKYQIVRTSGKDRGVTIAGGNMALLGPLHKLIYNKLTNQSWLLRGEARGRKFSSFNKKKGEVFVSGDYESATDNLNVDVAEFILRLILERCRNVPVGIRDFALTSLRAEIRYSAGIVCHQERGQLMGNYLSFPLLCLQNYLAFSYLVPRPVPLKINGDDIVFRCRPAEYDRWSEGVRECGLVLSRGKTMVNRTIFSLNSAFFSAESKGAREIPVIRLKDPGGRIPSGGDFLRFCRNWRRMSRVHVGALWLRRHASAIKATGRSIWDLGIFADNAQIHWSGLARREAWYRSEVPILAAKVPPVPILSRSLSPLVTKEWTKMPASSLHSGVQKSQWQSEFREACFVHSWTFGGVDDRAEDLWWEEVKRTGVERQYRNYYASLRKKPNLFRHFVRRDLRLRSLLVPVRVRSYWCPAINAGDSNSRRFLIFVGAV